MESPSAHLTNASKLHRRILNTFWIAFLFSIGVETITMYLSQTPHQEFIIEYLMKPTGLLLMTIVITEGYIRLFRRAVDYILLLSANFIATTLVLVHSSVLSIRSVMLIPVMISITFFEKRKVWFAGLLSGLTYLILYLMNKDIQRSTGMIDLCTFEAIAVGGVIIADTIIERGTEILNHLHRTHERNTDLMLRSTMIEITSKTDALTDAYNHKSFHEHLDQVIQQSDLNGLSVSLALLDIDDFKRVNDNFGHRVGDEVLKYVSHEMRRRLSSHDFVARYGGEEFAVIFVDKTPDEALQSIESVRSAIREMVVPDLGERHITVSIGLDTYVPGEGKNTLFERVDRALYAAKRSGKDRTIMYGALLLKS